MKKIAIISASVLALGAASIAADAGGMLPDATGLVAATAPSSAAAADTGNRGAVTDTHSIKRKIRLISSGVAPVGTCDAAFWPYYPSDCLKRVETTGL